MMIGPIFSLGPLMKAARKFKKLNQADVASAIGCSQSALSKMEHDLLVPSAPQWFLFVRFTAVPPETLETGVIDRHSRVRVNNPDISLGFKLPKKYRQNRAEKVKELYPFLLAAEKQLSETILKNFLDELQIDREFFLDFDNLMSFDLLTEFINFFIRHKLDSEASVEEIVKLGQNEIYWGAHHEKRVGSLQEALVAFLEEQPFHQGDFKVQMENLGEKWVVNFTPEAFFEVPKNLSQEALDFLRLYRKMSLKHFIQKRLGATHQVTYDPGPATYNNRFSIY